MKVAILDEAEQDLIDGYEFYESQQVGVGEYFLRSLFREIDSLEELAGVHSVHYGCHRLLSRKFPFAVYYRVEHETAWVYAVLDCRRDPEWTLERMSRNPG